MTSAILAKARTRDNLQAFAKLTHTVGRRAAPERRRLLGHYRLVHFACKVVGVGSVGTRSWIALCIGDEAGDPLFLQIKQAGPSVLEPFSGPSGYDNHAERIVRGQRLIQAAGNIFLGWQHAGAAGDFYVRQLRDWNGSADIEQMNPSAMSAYGRMCGWTLAQRPRARATASRSPTT